MQTLDMLPFLPTGAEAYTAVYTEPEFSPPPRGVPTGTLTTQQIPLVSPSSGGVPWEHRRRDPGADRGRHDPLRSRVPSVQQLVAEYGVAANTVQKVLTRLRDEGVVYTARGVGSFVAEPGE